MNSPLKKSRMLLIQQPISRPAAVALGTVSILLSLAAYTWLAQSRQTTKREVAATQRADVEAKITAVEQQLADATTADTVRRQSLTRDLERLAAQRETLTRDMEAAVDRSVPTWRSLYRDGLLRVLEPQGLRKDEHWLKEDLIATAKRLVGGLALGVILSVVLGILMGAYSPIEAFFVPPLAFLAKIPPTAMLAVFFVLVGTNYPMYMTIIAFGTLPNLAQTIYQSAQKDVPASLVFKAYTLGASHVELIWNVIFKQILPRLIDAVRLQIGPAMVLLVAAEWMVAGEGFGYRLRLFYQRTDMTVVYVYLFLLGTLGLAVDYFLIWFRRTLCPWYGK